MKDHIKSPLKTEQRTTIKSFLRVFLPLTALIVLIITTLYSMEAESEIDVLKHHDTDHAAVLTQMIGNEFELMVSDLMFLAENRDLRALIEGEIPRLDDLVGELLSFSKRKKLYEQIRFLDESGMEVVRINYNAGEPSLVPADQLEFGGGRCDFEDASDLQAGEVYVSPLDLKIERGEVERPLKPVIRLGTPVFDSHGGKKGVIIVDFLDTKLLQRIEWWQAHGSSDIMLINSEGYWLKGPIPQAECGDTLEDENEPTFANTFPDAWAKVTDTDQGQFQDADGLFTFSTVYPLMEVWKFSSGAGQPVAPSACGLQGDEFYWKIVLFSSSDALGALTQETGRKLFLLGAASIFVSLIGSTVLARSWVKRERAEEALRESEIQFRTLASSALDAIVMLDAQGAISFWNPAAESMFGYTSQQVMGQELHSLIALEKYHAVFHQGFAEFQKTGQGAAVGKTLEMTALRRDGAEFPAELSLSAFQRGDAWHAVGIVRDISQWVQAQAELRELNANLEAQVLARTAEIRAEQEKIGTILRNVADAIVMVDGDLRIRYVNAAFGALTGYTLDEVEGQPIHTLFGEEMPEQARASLLSALAQGRSWEGEGYGQRKDGREYEAALNIAPVFNGDESPTGFVASFHDIGRFKSLERARSRFLTNVSHELRTPVTNIKLYARLLSRNPTPEKLARYIEALQEQGDRLGLLIQDLLDMTAIDSGQGAEAWTETHLSIVIESAITRFQDQAAAAQLSLEAKALPPDLPIVMGDPTRLTQALNELVENAITFSPEGGSVTIEAQTVMQDEQPWVAIAVRDTGPGISPQEQERVFERFYRGDLAASGHIPGTGLGLSIAYEIARAHGGRLSVESQEGQGSTFTLWLKQS